MNEQELRSQLKSIVAEIIEVDDFGDDENFVTDLGVDSMMALEIVARIEKTYRIRIPEEYLPEVKSLNDVTRIVTQVMQPISG
ncbi:acyl carrier protein [Brevibacillus humidisoli]|uniref:acyl carrier protein n=1 Tax=Brevibacillus humidisoli TaxID=2895522 RepID=UPI001E5DE333|nr:acyl carrier protein [Brevibacillus humidisoli]UFJ42565.1 acyl carrier protein [Brevibacillus humidisoli]